MTGASENSEWDNNLPDRLFATDRFPSKRLNVYSKVDTLIFLQKTLEGTKDLETIKSSCFGKLFDLPAARCSISGKLIHALLTRQLVTKKKYVLWTVFGGQPLRFSLVEFGAITGLPCGEFEEDYDHQYQLPVGDASYEYWDKLIGPDRQATLGDIAEMLKNNPNMPSWRRIRLALILIVDGVLISSTQLRKPTPKYVKLVENLEAFMAFPWGRESFLWTLSTMKPKRKVMGKCESPIGTYRDQLQQTSFRLVGFPLVLQLLALEAIPVLLGKLGKALEEVKLQEYPHDKLLKNSSVTLTQVLDAEADPELAVKPTMDYKGARMAGWCEWDDEITDRKVDYMEKLIRSHMFKKSDWPGGDASLPFVRQKRKAEDVSRKKNVVESEEEDSSSENREKKREGKRVGVGKKKSSMKKQRRLSGYFVKGVEAVEKKLDLLIGHVEELTQGLRKMNERLDKAEKRGMGSKQGRVGKFSSQKRGSSRGIKRKRNQEPMPEVGRIESEGLSDDRRFTLISLKGNDGVSSQWIERTKWKSDSGEKMVDGNESGGSMPKHLRTKVDRMEEAKIASGGDGGVENEITLGLLNEGKVGTSGPGVDEEIKDEKVNISDAQDAVDERGTSGGVMEEGENEILSSLVLIGEGEAEKEVCEHEAVDKQAVDEVCEHEAVDKVGGTGPGIEEEKKDEQVNESGGQEIVDEACEKLNVSGGEESVNKLCERILNEIQKILVPTCEGKVEMEVNKVISVEDGVREKEETMNEGMISPVRETNSMVEVADPPLRSASSEQKRRGRKRKTAEEVTIVEHDTKPASVLPQVKPTQKKEESPNGSAKGIVVLFLKFSSHESMPSRDELTSTFSAFGPLDFSETHISKESSSAQVAFVSTGDTIKALKGLEEGNPFGETLVSFRLQPKMIFVQRTKASVISGFCPVLKLINTPTSVDSMKQNLLLMTEMLEESGARVSRETKAELKSDITVLLEKVNSMPSSSSS